MKKILLTLLIFVFTQNAFGQGINFQGVARSANGTILANQKISLKLSIITGSNISTPDYIETRSVATNTQGIFSIVVGDTGAISTIGTYASISWKTSSKFLKVEMDPNNGINFISMGTTPLQYVPFSYYSNGVDAANVAGVLPIKSGGTGVTSLSDLKVALVLDKVNNTADLDKPISTLTQAALGTKLNKADTSSLSSRLDGINSILTEDSRYNIKLGKNITTNVPAGYWNIGIGGSNLYNNTTGDRNIAIGAYALASNETGRYNIGIGSDALAVNIGGWNNNAIGLKSLGRSTTGNSNSALGFYSLQNVKDGSENTALGHYAGASLLAGSGNIFLGNNAGNNNLFTNVNNRLIIANSSTSSPLIYGEFENRKLKFNANIDSLTILNRINFIDENANDHINKYDTGYNSPLIYSRYFYGHYGDLVIQGMSKTYTGNIHFVTGSNIAGYDPPTQRMVIMDNGNIGIGDFAPLNPPTSKLQVNGIVSATGYKVPGGLSTQYLRADGTVTTSVTAGVPYTGASQATDLGAFDMKVNGVTVGVGPGDGIYTTSGDNNTNTIVGKNAFINNLGGSLTTAVGFNALNSNTTGTWNDAFGSSALKSNTTGSYNSSFGSWSLLSNTTGGENNAFGRNSLQNNTTGLRNHAFGRSALKSNTIGNDNTALGYASLISNTIGNENTSIGNFALFSNVANGASLAIGYNAMYYADDRTTGRTTGNTAVGYESIKGSSTAANNTGQNNTALGYQSLTSNTSGSSNTAIGYSAMSSSSTYSNSTALGYNAQVTASNQIQLGNSSVTNINTSGTLTLGSITYPNTAGTNGYYLKTDGSGTSSWAAVSGSGIPYTGATQATDLGAYDMKVNGLTIGTGAGTTTVTSSTAIGKDALKANTLGTFNTGIGMDALKANTEGTANTALGSNAMLSNTTTSFNTAIGFNSQTYATSSGGYNTSVGATSLVYGGSENTAFGSYTLSSNTGGENNAVGTYALQSNTTGSGNNSLGSRALKSNTTGLYNLAIGSYSLYSNVGNSRSVAIGHSAMYFADDRSTGRITGNTAVGYESLKGGSATPSNNTGQNNTALGYQTLTSNTSGSNNTAIGYSSMSSSSTYSNSTALGYNAQVTASNQIQLGDANITDVKTSGNITAKKFTSVIANDYNFSTGTNNVDLSLSNIFTINLTGNITLTFSNGTPGTYIIKIIQDATGSRTVTFPVSNWRWAGGELPSLSLSSGKIDIVTIIFDGTTYFATIVNGF